MTWDMLFKIVQTIIGGVVLALVVDYYKFRLHLSRDMITRTDCDACRSHASGTDGELFGKIDRLSEVVGDLKNNVGNIQTDLAWIKQNIRTYDD